MRMRAWPRSTMKRRCVFASGASIICTLRECVVRCAQLAHRPARTHAVMEAKVPTVWICDSSVTGFSARALFSTAGFSAGLGGSAAAAGSAEASSFGPSASTKSSGAASVGALPSLCPVGFCAGPQRGYGPGQRTTARAYQVLPQEHADVRHGGGLKRLQLRDHPFVLTRHAAECDCHRARSSTAPP